MNLFKKILWVAMILGQNNLVMAALSQSKILCLASQIPGQGFILETSSLHSNSLGHRKILPAPKGQGTLTFQIYDLKNFDQTQDFVTYTNTQGHSLTYPLDCHFTDQMAAL